MNGLSVDIICRYATCPPHRADDAPLGDGAVHSPAPAMNSADDRCVPSACQQRGGRRGVSPESDTAPTTTHEPPKAGRTHRRSGDVEQWVGVRRTRGRSTWRGARRAWPWHLRRQAQMCQDPASHRSVLDDRHEPESPATAATLQHVEATRLRAKRSGEVSPKLGVPPRSSEGGKLRRINCAHR